MTRRKPPLRRAEFEFALRELARSVNLRAEKRDDFSASFVDFGFYAHLESLDWQVIYGRRGTGKTHLLGALEENHSGLSRGRSSGVWVLLDGNDIRMTSPMPGASDETKAIEYFRNIQELIASALFDQVVQVERAQGIAALPTRATARRELEDAVLELNLAADLPLSRSSEDLRTIDHVRVDRFRAALERFLKIIGEPGFFLLIDEWSLLDDTALTDIQPLVAELLKRQFRGLPRASVKISAPRLQTKLSARGQGSAYLGLELGADIFEGANLDRNDQPLSTSIRLYTELLFKRLARATPSLADFRGHDGELSDEFLKSMFSSRAAFRELVRGSEGLPRRFLQTVVDLASQSRFNLERPWSVRQVEDSIIAASQEDAGQVAFASLEYEFIRGPVAKAVISAGDPVFLVPADAGDGVQKILDTLLYVRAIHEAPHQVQKSGTKRVSAFALSYARYLELVRALPPEDRPARDFQPPLDDVRRIVEV